MLKFGQALGKDIESECLSRIQSLSLVKILSLKFGQDMKAKVWMISRVKFCLYLSTEAGGEKSATYLKTPLTFSRNPNQPITVTGVWRNSLDPCWLLPVFARPQFPDCNHIVGHQLQKEKTGSCLNALFVSKKLLKYKIQKVS